MIWVTLLLTEMEFLSLPTFESRSSSPCRHLWGGSRINTRSLKNLLQLCSALLTQFPHNIHTESNLISSYLGVSEDGPRHQTSILSVSAAFLMGRHLSTEAHNCVLWLIHIITYAFFKHTFCFLTILSINTVMVPVDINHYHIFDSQIVSTGALLAFFSKLIYSFLFKIF